MQLDWSDFRKVATMSLREYAKVNVDITDPNIADLIETIYVWFDCDQKPLRVGTRTAKLGSRLLEYAKHINRSLAGHEKPTPRWEAEAWLQQLRHGTLHALAYQPDVILTPFGEIRPYLDIERVLIRQLKAAGLAQLNRSHR
ncbi:hypothetical protein BO068_005141 [Escherichia coli]|nr:hypothetical protein [Salmonella enterica subsp. enterica serovar Virchow]EFG2885942.1 hypothetical protein [Escherichia coli]